MLRWSVARRKLWVWSRGSRGDAVALDFERQLAQAAMTAGGRYTSRVDQCAPSCPAAKAEAEAERPTEVVRCGFMFMILARCRRQRALNAEHSSANAAR